MPCQAEKVELNSIETPCAFEVVFTGFRCQGSLAKTNIPHDMTNRLCGTGIDMRHAARQPKLSELIACIYGTNEGQGSQGDGQLTTNYEFTATASALVHILRTHRSKFDGTKIPEVDEPFQVAA